MHIHDRKSHFEIEGLSLRVFVYMCEREIVKSLFKLVKSFCLMVSFSNFVRSRFSSSADETIIGEAGGFELVGGRTGIVDQLAWGG